MEILEVGEVFKDPRTGDIFEVKKVNGDFVIMHSKLGAMQIMTGIKSVFHLFEKVCDEPQRRMP